MRLIKIPVPETVTAAYLVPLATAITVTDARLRTVRAVGQHVNGPLRTLILEWIRQGAVDIQVAAASDASLPVPEQGDRGQAKQLAQLSGVPAYALVSAASTASPVAVQEWKARGAAAALAADMGVPLVDARAIDVLAARDALASLPDSKFSDKSSSDLSIGLTLQPWVRIHAFANLGIYWAVSDGMWRFGLPEIRMGGCERDLREELKEILLGVAFRVWPRLVKDAQATLNATGLVKMPRSVRIPAEMEIHRKDLDQARGTPNRGGASTTISLRFDCAPEGRRWLTVCPPSWGDANWDYFIANVCHAMFGLRSPSGTTCRISALSWRLGDPCRKHAADSTTGNCSQAASSWCGTKRQPMRDSDGLRWSPGQTQTWPSFRDIGPELGPLVKPERVIAVETALIFDWAVWADGEGAVEGARTECIGYGF
jgi:hypothetical protein